MALSGGMVFVKYYPAGTAAFANTAKTTPEIEADKLEAMERPNIRSGRNAIDRLNRDDYDTEEADDLLTAYEEIDRSDYYDAEEYTEARHEAWDEFIQGIRDIDEAGEEEEEPEPEINPRRSTHRVPTYAQLDSQTADELVAMAKNHNLEIGRLGSRSALIMEIRKAIARKRGLAVDSLGNIYDPATGRSVGFIDKKASTVVAYTDPETEINYSELLLAIQQEQAHLSILTRPSIPAVNAALGRLSDLGLNEEAYNLFDSLISDYNEATDKYDKLDKWDDLISGFSDLYVATRREETRKQREEDERNGL